MVRSMSVGISGTRFSQAAAAHAIELAKKYRASLLGVAILDVAALCPPESVPLGAGAFKQERDEAVLERAREEVDRLLAQFARNCAAAGVACRTMKLEGDPAEALVVESQRVDLLVVGKKHLKEEGWEETSHTLRSILHHAARPVVCVPEKPTGGGCALVAFDGSLQSARTLQLFVASGMAAGRELHLLTIADDAPAAAERGLEFLHVHGLQVDSHLEEGDHPAGQILQTAARIDAGLIVMGAYGQPRIREFIFGSVTKAVLRDTSIPLFLYH